MKAKRLAALLLVVAMLFTFVSVIAACDKHELTSIEVTPNSVTLQVGQKSAKPTLTFTPDDADKEVTWASANTAVATVDGEGIITAVAAGSTKVTVTSKSASDVKAEIQVTVTAPAPILPTAIAVDPSSVSLEVGAKSSKPTLTFTPSNAANSVNWSSANTAIATVDNEGVITAVAPGSTVVSATSTVASGVKVEIQVTVSAQKVFIPLSAPVEGEYYFAMQVGNDYWYITGEMAATYYFGTTKDVNSAVKVQLVADGDGWLIKQGDRFIEISISGSHINAVYKTAQTAGKHWTWDATEKVFVWDNQYIIGNTGTYTNIGGISLSDKATNHFAVLGVFEQPAEPEEVTISKTGTIRLLPESTLTLSATVSPAKAPQDIDWSTSDAEKVTVVNGKITAVAQGTATITAKAKGTNVSATVTVEVLDNTQKGYTQGNPLSVDEAIALMDQAGDGVEVCADDAGARYFVAGTAKEGSTYRQFRWTFDIDGSDSKTMHFVTVSSLFVEQSKMRDGLLDNCPVVVQAILKLDGETYTVVNEGGSNQLRYAVITSCTFPQLTGITITGDNEVLEGSFINLKAEPVPQNAPFEDIEWHSSQEGKATVDTNGTVTGVEAGTTEITVSCGSVTSDPFTVTVKGLSANMAVYDFSGGLTADSVIDELYKRKQTGDILNSFIKVWCPDLDEITSFTVTNMRTGTNASNYGLMYTTAVGGAGTIEIKTTHQITAISFQIVAASAAHCNIFTVNENEVNKTSDGSWTGKIGSAYTERIEFAQPTDTINFNAPNETMNVFLIIGITLEW